LLDLKAPAQRSANIASYSACRGGWTFDHWNQTNDRSDNNLQKVQ